MPTVRLSTRALAATLFIMILSCPPFLLAQEAPHRGDVDGDWRVNVTDAYAVFRQVTGELALDAAALDRADVNRDGRVDETDVELLSIPEPCTPIFDDALPADFPAICAFEPETAAPGEMILLRVRGLSLVPGESQVFFGDESAEILPIDPRRVLVRIPEGAATGPVTLVVRGTKSLAQPFEILRRLARSYSLLPPPAGEFLLGVPRLRPKRDDVVSLPLVVTGGADLGAYTVSMEYDAGRMHGLWVRRGTAPFSTPSNPCIDNLIGRATWGGHHLGEEGQLFPVGTTGGVLARDAARPYVLWLADVRLATAHAGASYPRLRARVRVASDRAFPAGELGAPAPRAAWMNNNLVSDVDEAPPAGRPVIRSSDTAYAAPGTTVVLHGRSLGTDAARVRVWIDALRTRPLWANGESVAFVVPEGARSGLVRVHVGGSGTSNGIALAVLPDDASPTVDGISPPSGRKVRDGLALVNVRFSEVVDPDTIGPSTVYLVADDYYGILAGEDGELRVPCAYRIQNGPGQTIATLTPAFYLPPATGFRVVVTAGVTDLAGNPLADEAVSSFRTR